MGRIQAAPRQHQQGAIALPAGAAATATTCPPGCRTEQARQQPERPLPAQDQFGAQQLRGPEREQRPWHRRVAGQRCGAVEHQRSAKVRPAASLTVWEWEHTLPAVAAFQGERVCGAACSTALPACL